MDLETVLTIPAAALSFGLLWLGFHALERRKGAADRRVSPRGGRRVSDMIFVVVPRAMMDMPRDTPRAPRSAPRTLPLNKKGALAAC
jgi:hypothetical protein